MCVMRRNSLLQMCSKSQYSTQFFNQCQTALQAKVTLDEGGQEKYIIRLKQSFIVLYPLLEGLAQQLAYIPVDSSLKMSRVYRQRNYPTSRAASQPIGIKLQNQQALTITFYFKTANEVYTWIKQLSMNVIQLDFQKLHKPIRRLGKGASATVYQAIRLQDSKKLAVKVFSKRLMQKSFYKKRSFKKQLNILKDLSFENILRFEGVFQSNDTYYLLMQLAKGVNILEFLVAKKFRLSDQQICTLMRNILRNLHELSELNIIHRDIKLQNIVVNPITLKTTIIDYGLAVYADEEDFIYYSCGTPGYIPPETISNQRQITTKSDIFSVGVIFYVLLTGKFLFNAKDAKQVQLKNANMEFDISSLRQTVIDRSAFELLEKMLALQPEERYSASECLSHVFFNQKTEQEFHLPHTPCKIGAKQQLYRILISID